MWATLDFNWNLYSSHESIFTLATPDFIAAFATEIGIFVSNLGSKIDGIIYSLPN